MSETLVELRGISKSFGTLTALDNVSLSLAKGQTMGLVGDNGAGKSTLIKILSGVHPADSGEIWFEARKVTLPSPLHARRLGIETVFQDLALVDHLSVARNFFLSAEITRQVGPLRLLDVAEMNRKAASYLSEIGITRLTSPEKEVRFLSGGERQAIAIARHVLWREVADPG